MSKAPTRVGVVMVHGIGEQRRFEHVDGQVRDIINALGKRPGTRVTTEIIPAPGGAFHATADSWNSKVSVRIYVQEGSDAPVEIDFHEVWWADVNEPYSLMKQVRFWVWSLSVWLYPGKSVSTLPSADTMEAPQLSHSVAQSLWNRVRLFGVGFVAVLAAASIGLVTFLAERILKIQPPDIVRTFVNYVAGVKLYNQRHRMGAGIPSQQQDFLDSVGEPPRVSIRRRMIRALLTMRMQGYDRWYVVAHSLGTVVAFNGLMESAYAWPGYLDRETWESAVASRPPLAGPASARWPSPPPGETSPKRPVWVGPREVAYRSQIFSAFRGILTFGSPLEKFAAIWPARVSINKEFAFGEATEWINVMDPTDPVSGVLKAFNVSKERCPMPRNLGFAAGPVLLLSHLKYLRAAKSGKGVADGLAEWLVNGSSAQFGVGPDWFVPGKARSVRRSTLAWITWAFVVVLLLFLGSIVAPPVISGVRKTDCAVERRVQALGLSWVDTGCPTQPPKSAPSP